MNESTPSERPSLDDFRLLRHQAEVLVNGKAQPKTADAPDILGLIHQLHLHQTELELQNEELRRTQQELTELYQCFEDLYEFAPCVYLNLDVNGMITRINQAGTKMIGDARGSLMRTPFSYYIAPQWRNSYWGAYRQAKQTGEKQELELKIEDDDNTAGWVWAQIVPLYDNNGIILQWRVTLTDISARKRTEADLQASEQKYRQLFEEMVGGAALMEIARRDAVGRVTDVRVLEINAAGEELTGLMRDQAVGSTFRELFPRTEPFWFNQVDLLMRGRQSVQTEGYSQELGKHLRVSLFRLDEHRFGATFIDISDHKRIETELEQARQNLEHKVRQRTANLEEANTALQVLLKQYDQERRKLEEKVVSNVNEQVRPYLAKLAAGSQSPRQKTLLEAVERSLDDIASPMSRSLIINGSQLTPVESQVAGLIRQGKATKEIAEIMGVARSTIDYHRLNIRRKLKLSRSTNLQSYLNSLE